ncbi:MAG: putative toxin-antitoxin system toxin component, PIN family [Chitinophagaceae bacterium]
MPAKTKKVKRFIIDANTYITLFINGEAYWFQDYVMRNNLEIFTDIHLMDELANVLDYPKIKSLLPLNKKAFYLAFVHSISTHIESKNFHIKSPDPDDNYLYNLALTANAKLLFTGEKALLQWIDTPVETISLSIFKKLF